MRDWARQHPYLAMAFGYVLVFVLGAGVSLAFDASDPAGVLFRTFMNTLVYWLIALFQVRTLKRTKHRLDERGQFRAFIRHPDALPGSLSGIWNQGIATLGEGTLLFQPAVYDTLEPSGRSTEIKVHEVLPGRRKITGKDRKYLPVYGYRAVTLLTEGGSVELAASPESLDKFTETLEPGSAQAPDPQD